MLIQIHRNLKFIEKYLGVLGQNWVTPFCSQDSKIGFLKKELTE